MAITSLLRNITPKQAKAASISQTGLPVSGTWYSVVAVTNSRGVLNRVVATLQGTTDYNNQYFEFRITIDGVANTITNPSGSYARGLNHGERTTNNASATNSFDYFTTLYFYSSLTVEVRLTTVPTNGYINAAVDYCIE